MQHYRSIKKSSLYFYPWFSTTSTIAIQVFTQLLDSHMKRPKAMRVRDTTKTISQDYFILIN